MSMLVGQCVTRSAYLHLRWKLWAHDVTCVHYFVGIWPLQQADWEVNRSTVDHLIKCPIKCPKCQLTKQKLKEKVVDLQGERRSLLRHNSMLETQNLHNDGNRDLDSYTITRARHGTDLYQLCKGGTVEVILGQDTPANCFSWRNRRMPWPRGNKCCGTQQSLDGALQCSQSQHRHTTWCGNQVFFGCPTQVHVYTLHRSQERVKCSIASTSCRRYSNNISGNPEEM